jgi:pimeloyl-ACP methyl ester carboxylesterase
MRLRFIFIFVLSFLVVKTKAQTNIQAWYKHGQVWIVWDETLRRPDVYEIYMHPTPFDSIHQATLVGKLAQWEWSAGAIRDQMNNSSFNWKVPHPHRSRRHQLDSLKGLFVYTPHTADTAYFAVVKRGNTLVTSGVNRTAAAVHYDCDPVNDPITCHQQASKTLDGYKTTVWAMWADGREDHWNGRPDFPVMANQHKNGQPGIFIVSEALNMDTTAGNTIPAVLWLHGGDGNAIQSLPMRRPQVNLIPKEGILVAHNDDFVRYERGKDSTWTVLEQPSNSWFFGWAKNKDPYDSLHAVVAINDTIVNYTQRRLDWINDWLIENYHVDPERIHINGHSMGSAGTTALMKTYPNRYASVTIFNNGLNGHSNSDQGYSLFGDTAWNNPTNLYRRDGTNVRIKQVFNLNDRNSQERDFPLVRMFHGKNDDNGVMMWDAYVVSEYKKADSLKWGMQLYWSERGHGIDTGANPNHPDHWTHGVEDTTQTVRDNVAYEEAKYRNTSFPAFYNHRLDPQAPDPGDGSIGIIGNGGTGDDWGTWGGYHDWNSTTLLDEPDQWQVTAWLMDSAVYNNDNCPFNSLVSSLAIRKPQYFNPPSGTTVYWSEIDSATNIIIKEGETTVGLDDLIAVDSVVLYRYPVKTYISFTLVPASTYGTALPENREIFSIFPNPSSDQLHVLVDSPSASNKWVTLYDFTGAIKMKFQADEVITKVNIAHLKPDTYFVKFNNKTLRFVKY